AHETDYAYEQCRQNLVKLVYVAPERRHTQRFSAMLASVEISLIVVDEAHCISQWGYDFRPSYLHISRLREEAGLTAPLLALTASATPRVVDDIAGQLGMSHERRFSLSFSRDNISFLVRHTGDKFGKLLEILRGTTGSVIVYTRSRRRASDLAAMLQRQGVSALFYHAGLEVHEKASRQDEWASGRTRVMVATTAFGMGIDKPDVRVVVHYDIPSALEEYYQEAGRAGRDGLPSVAVMTVADSDRATLARRLASAFPEKDYIRTVYDEICRFLSVPMGEGFGAVYDFRPEEMCARYNMDPRRVLSAIRILYRAEYISYTGPVDREAEAMICVGRHELYTIEFDAREESVMDYMLRNYSGLFTDFVQINESLIAAACGLRQQTVSEILVKWRREHIIRFIPRRSSPQILFTANRVPSEQLIIPRAVYEDRRRAMEGQIKAMTDFAFDDSACRVAGMLRYFGETPVDDCEKCDICRTRRSKATPLDTAALERRLDSFFDTIAPHKWLDIRSLRPYYPHHYDEVVSHIDSLVHAGRLKADGALIAKC
ncbi:MAG: RecQ family ATP-dependent DNA helicase, partial [Muribaculaceae bacterium]|nr:RecQ family ATP-dependent DNA helicase [Muribaculaceae bacterium]